MSGAGQRDLDEVEAEVVLRQAEQDWRPVPLDTMANLFNHTTRLARYRAALETYWDMYADKLVACCTVFAAIALLQRCLLSADVDAALVPALPPACLWVSIKVVEGQEAGGLLSAAVMCHEWNKASTHTVEREELLTAERYALILVRVDVMKRTSFDTFVLCLRMCGMSGQEKDRAYQRALELLILIEGRPETLSYSTAEVAAALCIVVGMPVPPPLRQNVEVENDRVQRAVQYLESFEVEQ